jgi:multiple sugar transport system permease protein
MDGQSQIRMNRVNLLSRRTVKDSIAAYLFLSPALFIFALFVGGPIVMTIFLGFTEYNIISPIKFIGLTNFKSVLHDHQALTVILNTFKFVIVLVPLHVVIGLLLALGVTRKIPAKLKYFYRTSIYFPTIVTTASVAIAWTFLLNKDFGVINYYLGKLGIEAIPWLASAIWTIPSIAMFSVWKFVGNSFMFYVIGLQNIPDSFYEAAQIDGANRFQVFFKITLPLLSPTIFFVITTTIIGAMQIFDEPFLITRGGPGDSSRTIALHIYQKAFQSYDMGYASAFALLLLIIVLVITIAQFTLQKKWVNYDYE